MGTSLEGRDGGEVGTSLEGRDGGEVGTSLEGRDGGAGRLGAQTGGSDNTAPSDWASVAHRYLEAVSPVAQ